MPKLTELENRVSNLEKDREKWEAGFSLMLTLISVLLYLSHKTPTVIKKLIVSDNVREYRRKLVAELKIIAPLERS